MSVLSADDRGLVAALAPFGIEVLWHPALSEASGEEALEILEAAASGALSFDCLCVEGSVMTGPKGTGLFQILSGTGRPMSYWIDTLGRQADYVVAVGSCSSFGGIPASGRDRQEVTGLQFGPSAKTAGLFDQDFRSGSGLPVINIAGCAPHPGWVIETLSALSIGGFDETDLDHLARPRFFADHLAHHGCARNEFYEFKASAVEFSDRGCLMEHLGCKATQAQGDCNLRIWNGSSGSCTDAGFPCVNCTSPGFETPGHAFQATPKVGGIPVGLPADMPKAWFVALAALSKSATPHRVRANARSDRVKVPPKRGRGEL